MARPTLKKFTGNNTIDAAVLNAAIPTKKITKPIVNKPTTKITKPGINIVSNNPGVTGTPVIVPPKTTVKPESNVNVTTPDPNAGKEGYIFKNGKWIPIPNYTPEDNISTTVINDDLNLAEEEPGGTEDLDNTDNNTTVTPPSTDEVDIPDKFVGNDDIVLAEVEPGNSTGDDITGLDNTEDILNSTQSSSDERAEAEAEANYEFEAEKARGEAIERRRELMKNNADMAANFFSSAYNSSQKIDKFGWTGGQLMDAKSRVGFLQAGLNAKMYQDQAMLEAGLDNKLAIARKYQDLKQTELANKYYQEAQTNAFSRAQITGTYISPEAYDMINNYKLAMTNGNEELMATIESYFIAQGFGYTDEEGNEQIDPATIIGMVDIASTVAQQQLDFDKELSEYAKEEAMRNNEYRENRDLDGDGLIGSLTGGLNDETIRTNPETGQEEYWSYDQKVWMNAEDHAAYMAEKNNTDDGTDDDVINTDDDVINTDDGTDDDKITIDPTRFDDFDDVIDPNQAIEIKSYFEDTELFNNSTLVTAIKQNTIREIIPITSSEGYTTKANISYIDTNGAAQSQTINIKDLLLAAVYYDTDFGQPNFLEQSTTLLTHLNPNDEALILYRAWKSGDYSLTTTAPKENNTRDDGAIYINGHWRDPITKEIIE